MLLSLILYVGSLGFYSDDWSFLGSLSLSADRSLGGLVQSIYSPNVQMRPVQLVYLAGLYQLFGERPLGYHWVNAVVFLSGILLFHLVLRKLGLSRTFAIAIPLLYGLMPNYSTNRFWYAAFQANLSLSLYFLSFYSDLEAVESEQAKAWFWRMVSLISLVTSALAYEVFMPLFLINPLLIWQRDRTVSQSRTLRSWLLGINWIILINLFAFKAASTTRMAEENIGSQLLANIRQALSLKFGEYSFGLNFKQAIAVHYGVYGVGLSRTVLQALSQQFDWKICVLALILGLAIFQYLDRIHQAEIHAEQMLKSIGVGFVVFGLGYAVFFTNHNVGFSPTGIINRTAIAAAVGVALSIVGSVGLLSCILKTKRSRHQFFCGLLALICASGCFINNFLAAFWITAYQQEKIVLSSIYQQFPSLPTDSVMLLDGVCPYVGPAIVFESNWDLAGALSMLYQDYTLQADVVTPRLTIEQNGISTLIYSLGKKYAYDRLFIYHFGRKTVHPITSPESAQLYFQTFPTNRDPDACPKGYPGFGVPIF